MLGDEARRSTARLVHRLRLSAEATRELSSSLEPQQVVQSIIERRLKACERKGIDAVGR